MNKIMLLRPAVLLVIALLALPPIGTAVAGTIVTTLGNDAPGFNDGDVPPLVPDILNAQNGQPAPFDSGKGNEVLGPNFSASWTFNYLPIVDPILSASLVIGILDHDSQAAGNQVSSFAVEAEDLTAGLNLLFESSGGGDGEYNIYTISLPASAFVDLLDGVALASLALAAPGLETPLFPLPGPNPPTTTNFNAATLIYSTLTISTQSSPAAVPLPATLPLLCSGLALLGLFNWRNRRRGQA